MTRSADAALTACTAAAFATMALLPTRIWLPNPDLLSICGVLAALGIVAAIIPPGVWNGRVVALWAGSFVGSTIIPLLRFGPGTLWPFAVAVGGFVTVLGTGIGIGFGSIARYWLFKQRDRSSRD